MIQRRVFAALLIALGLPTPAPALFPHGGVATTVSGSLTPLTVVETTRSTQSNVPLTFGLPFDSGVKTSSTKVQAVITGGADANPTPLACDENNTASDLGTRSSYTPTIRFNRITCVMPTLTANTTDTITLSVVSGSPSTGADLSIANITSTAYDNLITIDTRHGTTETASPLTALNSGHTSWVNTSTAAVLAQWTGTGGLSSGYISYVPFKSGGGTQDPDGVYALMDTECVKGSIGAYNSGTNPIIRCTTDVVIGDSVAQNTGTTDAWFGMVATPSGCNPGSNWAKTQPAGTLTLSSNVVNTTVLATAPSGTFTAASVGTVIDDGTGFGIVSHYNNSTTADLQIFRAYSATSISSGNYSLYPINMPYGARISFRCWWSPSGTPSNVDYENGNLYLGNAWNGTGGSGIGPGQYLMDSRLLPNLGTYKNPGIVGLTNISLASSNSGANPSGLGYINGVGSRVGAPSDGACSGLVAYVYNTVQQSSGEYEGRFAAPQNQIAAALKWDSAAASVMFQGAERFGTWLANTIDNRTGAVPDPGNTPQYQWAPYGGVGITPMQGEPSTGVPYIGCWFTWPNTAHAPDPFFLPYLLTGDWKWLMYEANNVFSLTSGHWNVGFVGTGRNLAWLGNQGAADDERGEFWPWLILGHLTLIMPDRNSDSTPLAGIGGFNKTGLQTVLENNYSATGSGEWNKFPAPGVIIALIGTSDGGTCPGGMTCNPNYTSGANGYRSLNPAGYGFESVMGDNMGAWLYEMGMLSPNGMRFWKWFANAPITAATDNNAQYLPNFMFIIPVYHWQYITAPNTYPGPTTYVWDSSYKEIAIGGNAHYGGNTFSVGYGREPNGTVRLSGSWNTVGGTVTVNLPVGKNWLAAGSWYNTGWFATYDGGQCQIVSVTSPTSFTCTVVATAFKTNSYTNNAWVTGGTFNATHAQWFIPFNAPTDPGGLEIAGVTAQFAAGDSNGYFNISRAAVIQIDEYLSIPNSATAVSNMQSVGVPLYNAIAWNILHR